MKKASKKSQARPASEMKPNDEKRPRPVATDEQNSEDGRMDFGGLPDRDLKKNLGGCG